MQHRRPRVPRAAMGCTRPTSRLILIRASGTWPVDFGAALATRTCLVRNPATLPRLFSAGRHIHSRTSSILLFFFDGRSAHARLP